MITYKGRKGEYTIVREAPGQLLVKYLSGEWKNKEVWMAKTLHDRIQENIEVDKKIIVDAVRQDLTDKLDLWFEKYPALYTSLWQEAIHGETLLKKLEEEYPEAAANVDLEVEQYG